MRFDPGAAANAVYRRDKGVCSICQLDTRTVRAAIEQITSSVTTHVRFTRCRCLGCLLWREYRAVRTRAYWEMDHIVAVADGGGAIGLENLRTLCVPCHKRITHRQATERKIKRMAQKIIEATRD